MRLSPYGQLLLPHVNQIFEELEQGLSSIESRIVRVSYIDLLETSLIPELPQSLAQEEENQWFQLELCHATTGAAKERLRQRTLDFAFCLEEEEMEGLEWMTVQRIPFVLIAPGDHPLGQREAVSLEEVAAYPFLSYKGESGMRRPIERAWKNRGISPIRAGGIQRDGSDRPGFPWKGCLSASGHPFSCPFSGTDGAGQGYVGSLYGLSGPEKRVSDGRDGSRLSFLLLKTVWLIRGSGIFSGYQI